MYNNIKCSDKRALKPKLTHREICGLFIIIGLHLLPFHRSRMHWISWHYFPSISVCTKRIQERKCFNEIAKFDRPCLYLSAYRLHDCWSAHYRTLYVVKTSRPLPYGYGRCAFAFPDVSCIEHVTCYKRARLCEKPPLCREIVRFLASMRSTITGDHQLELSS